MKKNLFALCMAGMMLLSACSANPGLAEDMSSDAPNEVIPTETVEANDAPTQPGTYQLDDLTISAPTSWVATRFDMDSGYRTEFRDPAIVPEPWGDIEVSSYLSVLVTTADWALQSATAQERTDYLFQSLNTDEKTQDLLVIDGVTVGMVTHNRPYFNYKLTNLFFPYNGKEYNIDIHYDAANADLSEIAATIIDSIVIAQ